ncbi:uncharacterized protein LOC108192412 isoform X2 [Daucus carota subsp. sativus]|uniref:uncharacterized protein LOC108192412 isoform X2 n=1 Tax=Daucus carota subsp. sativus TaxID=79200 RepID=UPI0007EF240B|nr:PREDICTED: syndetin isoform X2 [Daucus carota subsp. sativus]
MLPTSPLPFTFNPLLSLTNESTDAFEFEFSKYFPFNSSLFSRGMDLSRFGEKILSSVRSARSLNRPEVPARAVAAAAIARALASLPPHQRYNISSSSEELTSIYGSATHGEVVAELEEEFYQEEFDPVRHVLENIPSEEIEVAYFEEKAALRLAQLDKISEHLSRHVMEHYEQMVNGMHLVRELEKDLKVANVICMNGRRHLNSSRTEVSRDLIVTTNSKRKQALLDMLPVLTELRYALDIQVALETHVEQGNFCKAFQVLSEYLQLLDSFSELSAVQEMSRGVEVWLGKTLQKLDSLLLGVCKDFKEESYITVVDAYAIIGDVSGLAEKVQSFFMQEVLSETHSVLKNIIREDAESPNRISTSCRLTYSDLCLQIPELKFRQCLLETLAVLFDLMCSYYAIMSFQPENQDSTCRPLILKQKQDNDSNSLGDNQHVSLVTDSNTSHKNDRPPSGSAERSPISNVMEEPATDALCDDTLINGSDYPLSPESEARDGGKEASSSGSPWLLLRNDATVYVSQTLQRGRKNLLQLATSRVAVLLSSSAVCSTSIHEFLKNYEDLNVFILLGESFSAVEAVEFRHKVKDICENYFAAFHRQNVYALKMVMERENWMIMPSDTTQAISFAGLVGDGAALIVPSNSSSTGRGSHSSKSANSAEIAFKKSGFSDWLEKGNPFSMKLATKEPSDSLSQNGLLSPSESEGKNLLLSSKTSPKNRGSTHINGYIELLEDENEDLLADFIDEDSQLPSRISITKHTRNRSSHSYDTEAIAHTGSSLCLLRLMDKYARLMQKLEIINIDFFKGICQLFGLYFSFVFESFGQQNTHPSGQGSNHHLTYRLKTALSRISQDSDPWIKSQSVSSSLASKNVPSSYMDITPASPPSANFSNVQGTSFGLQERCAGADTISVVAQLLHRSKAHLQSMVLQNSAAKVEEFYVHMVDAVPDLIEHIHRTTAKSLLHISGYVDRIANAKWEVKELGLEHNGYVDLLLGEFKHYKTRLAHGGLRKEVQDILLEYGLENVAEILIEGLSRVKRCTDEGRALMSLDLQVLINGLHHFVSVNVKSKLQIVETFIKAYYLPETEYVHWTRAHPEYNKSHIIGLINLVATMKGWKRKTRLEVLEKIESAIL